MKTLTLCIATLFFAAFTTVEAQVTASNEPRGTVDPNSGEIILMPVIPTLPTMKPAATTEVDEDKEPVIRNVSQLRSSKMNKKRNGFYVIEKDSNWGTNIRMNSYGFSKPAGDGMVLAEGSAATAKLAAKP